MSVFTEKLQQEMGRTFGAPSADSRIVPSSSEDSQAADDDPSHSGAQPQLGSERVNDDSTADVEEFARIRLQHSPYRAIRRVGCSYADGTLTLSGAVPTYHYKQLAQTAVNDIAGVQRIVNQIDVG